MLNNKDNNSLEHAIDINLIVACEFYKNNDLDSALNILDRTVCEFILQNDQSLKIDSFWKTITVDVFKAMVLNHFHKCSKITTEDLYLLCAIDGTEYEVDQHVKEFCENFKNNSSTQFTDRLKDIEHWDLRSVRGILATNLRKIKELTVVPEDFSFALTWNCYGVSSYDSKTGKLVKTTDATNPDDYVTQYQLVTEDKEFFYNLLVLLDVNSFPDIYNPKNGASKPPMTLVLTVRINGKEKTIKAENISVFFVSEDKKGQQFLSVCETISNRLEATKEWKALPDYERLYI